LVLVPKDEKTENTPSPSLTHHTPCALSPIHVRTATSYVSKGKSCMDVLSVYKRECFQGSPFLNQNTIDEIVKK
jgi:hypothetical protein